MGKSHFKYLNSVISKLLINLLYNPCMHKQDLKYFLVLLLPLFGYLGLRVNSYLSPGSFYLGFIVIPLIELFMKPNHKNLDPDEKPKRSHMFFFDLLLYSNIPILYFLLAFFFYVLKTHELNSWEFIASLLNMGILLAVLGINVAHEIGHRNSLLAKCAAQLLLIPSLYMHFTAAHNYGHHRFVGTAQDPSSATLNESIYSFWLRSIKGVFMNAIHLESKRLSARGLQFFHWRNRLIMQFGVQLTYLFMVYLWAGIAGLVSALIIALISILLLESINYIEHYALVRKTSPTGIDEAISLNHSWNSDHTLGRIFLYELTRHPYHHLHANDKYQNLDSIAPAPQLPQGYPSCMLMALIPPLWFYTMNKRIPNL